MVSRHEIYNAILSSVLNLFTKTTYRLPPVGDFRKHGTLTNSPLASYSLFNFITEGGTQLHSN